MPTQTSKRENGKRDEPGPQRSQRVEKKSDKKNVATRSQKRTSSGSAKE